MYVAGREHPFKEPSTSFLRKVALGEVTAASDVEVLQEILYRYYHTGEIEKGFRVFDVFIQTIPHIHTVTLDDLLTARQLLSTHPTIKPRDAIHAAVMLRVGVRTIASYDHHFDDLEGIRRLEP
jgi:predicted nucleic acid-binding protein